jgi:putative cardiolipin synthase
LTGQASALGRATAPLADAHPGQCGIFPLADAREAFAARVLLARAAERTLDVQYYIWRADTTGTLLLEALHEAAERGVRVRLLLDDNGTAGMDGVLAALDTHPLVQVRLFNPFRVRRPKWLGYLTDFARANRRMHNKSFTADGEATIVGGRNVGDEYFGATDGVLFSDLDVLAVGPVVPEVAQDFDRYWNCASSCPVAQVLPPAEPALLQALAARARSAERDPRAAAYVQAIARMPFVHELVQGRLPLQWAPTRMVSDDPAKGLGRARDRSLMIRQLAEILGTPASHVDLVSPYFVPGAAGAKAFEAMRARGVQVRVLTNALEATDVTAVHAGYARRRRRLLRAGVELYELRRAALPPGAPVHRRGLLWRSRAGTGSAGLDGDAETPGQRRKGSKGGNKGKSGKGAFGSSGSSLHAKTFAVDGRHVFIGSFNFDPRSVHLNTELGFVIDSPLLAREVDAAFDGPVPQQAYTVQLDARGALCWTEQVGSRTVRHRTEPGTRWWQRAGVTLLSWLPIEWLL